MAWGDGIEVAVPKDHNSTEWQVKTFKEGHPFLVLFFIKMDVFTSRTLFRYRAN